MEITHFYSPNVLGGIICLFLSLLAVRSKAHSKQASNKTESSSQVETVSLPAFLFFWINHLSFNFADVLYQIGLHASAPFVKVILGPFKVYIVRSSELTVQLAKESRNLSMAPIYSDLVEKVASLDHGSFSVIQNNMMNPKVANPWSQIFKAFHHSMVPGSAHDSIVSGFITHFGERFRNDLLGRKDPILDPYYWLQRAWLQALGPAVWGLNSPFSDLSTCNDWWTFRDSAPTLFFGVWPKFFYSSVRRGVKAKERMLKRFTAYYADVFKNMDSFTTPSRVLSYASIGKKWGLNHEAIARLDLTNTLGLFKDAIDACYGMIAHIYSRPALLAQIRAEFQKVTTRTADGELKLHAHSFRENCPTFHSCFYETLRLTGAGFAVRSIANSFSLDDGNIVLKKNSLVFVAGTPINMNPEHWDNPETFKPDRFVGIKAPEVNLSSIYRPFGGGAAVCLGRQIAPPMCLTAVGSMIAALDFEPLEGNEWAIPDPKFATPPEAATPPRGVGETKVKMAPRKGFEGVNWTLCEGCGIKPDTFGVDGIFEKVAQCAV